MHKDYKYDENYKTMSIVYMMISTQFSASIAKQMIVDLDALTITIFRLFFAKLCFFHLHKKDLSFLFIHY